jgi:hypothetical protein
MESQSIPLEILAFIAVLVILFVVGFVVAIGVFRKKEQKEIEDQPERIKKKSDPPPDKDPLPD